MSIASCEIEDVLWTVTYRCNLSCVYCSVDAGNDRTPFPEPELWQNERIADQITTLPNLKSVILTGGEFLQSPHYPSILKKLAEKNISLFVITNGTYISDQILTHLQQSKATVMVSLDSTNSDINVITRGYRQSEHVISNIERYMRSGLKLVTIMVITRYNINTMIEDLIYLYQRGVSNVLLQQLHAEGRGSDLYRNLSPTPYETQVLYQSLKQFEVDYPDVTLDYNEICLFPMRPDQYSEKCDAKTRYKPQRLFMCGAGYKFLAIKSNGDLIPCNAMQEYVFGNILESDLLPILEDSEKLATLKEWRSHRVNECAGCETCPYNPVCDGGCRADVINLGLGLLAKHPYCCFS